jgi:quercetin dioxygenase-like cupin family protein
MHRFIWRAVGPLLLALLLVAPQAFANQATPAATQPPVVREVINEGMPGSAPGQMLQLVRYVISANTILPVHIHPGMQVAMVESGTLHYTVVEGSATFARANGDTGVLNAGEETDFGPGDSLVEARGMVHFGENRTDEPVVLLVASLFDADAPPSSIVVVATPVASPAPRG